MTFYIITISYSAIRILNQLLFYLHIWSHISSFILFVKMILKEFSKYLYMNIVLKQNLSPTSLLRCLNEPVPKSARKKKKMNDEEFIIPDFSEYEFIVIYNYLLFFKQRHNTSMDCFYIFTAITTFALYCLKSRLQRACHSNL